VLERTRAKAELLETRLRELEESLGMANATHAAGPRATPDVSSGPTGAP
jgi:BMFP domain-containing protein YqiC